MKINRIKSNYIILILLLMCLFLCAGCGAADKTSDPAPGTVPSAAGSSNGTVIAKSAVESSNGNAITESAAASSNSKAVAESAAVKSNSKAITESAVGSASGSTTEEAASLREDPLWSDPDSLTAMVVSDLHYTENRDLDHSLVPGLALAREITDALVDEVIDRHPDVLIMTGDNTNSGYPEEVSGLTARLQRIKDEGIGIILTTGNHDFDSMDAKEFEEAYFSLLSPVDRDPASLSYTSIVKDVVFFAMDDNAVYPGGQGQYSAETMQWLEEMLTKYRDSRIIFLSHHNVLYGRDGENPFSNLIQNPELPALLNEHGVRLAMTGHMHFQYILEKDELWEIISGMPFSGTHLVGNLAVSRDKALYYAESIDFASYDPAIEKDLEKLDRESSDYMNEVLSSLLDQQNLRGAKKEKVLDLINRYFLYYNNGSLADHIQELKNDPSYNLMIQALWNYNYGPWIKEMTETTTHSGRELEIVFEEDRGDS